MISISEYTLFYWEKMNTNDIIAFFAGNIIVVIQAIVIIFINSKNMDFTFNEGIKNYELTQYK